MMIHVANRKRDILILLICCVLSIQLGRYSCSQNEYRFNVNCGDQVSQLQTNRDERNPQDILNGVSSMTENVMQETPTVDLDSNEISGNTLADLQQVQKLISKAHRYARSGKTIHLLGEAHTLLSTITKEPTLAYESKATLVTNDVCPEIYMGSIQTNMGAKYGLPFFYKGYEIGKCTAPPISEIVSVVLFAENKTDIVSIGDLHWQIHRLYPNVAVFLVAPSSQVPVKIKEVVTVIDSKTFKGTAGISEAVRLITTKYVLFARGSIEVVDSNIRLERLIRTLAQTPGGVAVGGSYRNATGHWRLGCYQSAMRNYAYRIVEGYDLTNSHSCVYCDIIAGPFVTYTKQLQDFHIGKFASAEVGFLNMFEEWKANGKHALICADSMFHVKQHTPLFHGYRKPEFHEFATSWGLNVLQLPYKHGQIKYNCKEVNMKCFKGKGGIAVPRCCVENLAGMFRYAMQKCVENRERLGCVVSDGTVIDAIKHGGVSPWNFDADLKHRATLGGHDVIRSFKNDFQSRGYSLRENKGCNQTVIDRQYPDFAAVMSNGVGHCGSFNLLDGFWEIDMWGRTRTGDDDWVYRGGQDPELFKGKNRTGTLVYFDGVWQPTYGNPALYARNQYADDIFQHIEHWRALNDETVAADAEAKHTYKTGSFVKCPRPGHHSCLDQYLGEGNIQFKEIYL